MLSAVLRRCSELSSKLAAIAGRCDEKAIKPNGADAAHPFESNAQCAAQSFRLCVKYCGDRNRRRVVRDWLRAWGNADCHMPTMNGFEMTREIRARESASGFSKIPIIAITADAVGHDRQKGIDVGMDAYLTKPVRLGDLSQMLSLYLVGEEQGRGAVRRAP